MQEYSKDDPKFQFNFHENIPKVVYKYRDWNNSYHRRMLTNQEVYFASSKEFNDPFDFAIPLRYDLLSKEEWRIKYWEMVYNHSEFGRFPYSMKDVSTEVDRLMQEGPHTNPEIVQQNIERQMDSLADAYGVFCCTKKPTNILMWSHYANCHTGFCIGFDSLRLHNESGATIGSVIYADKNEIPVIKPSGIRDIKDLIQQAVYKSPLWSYESEIRLFKILKFVPNSSRLITVPPQTIREVIFGCKMAAEHSEEIMKLLLENKEFNHVKVYKAIKDERKFSLNLLPVN